MTALRVRPAAERDVDAVADYYAAEANLDVALRFLAAIEEAYRQLAQHPHAGALARAFSPRLEGLRFWSVPGFESYLAFYVTSPGCVEVVRVLHGARDLARALGAELEEDLDVRRKEREEEQERER